ncbi:uncharacterized protein N7469_006107 [Penicillium citrinum]|uniref:Uncharacterized protein n=1 Tax=Penicillium citrinum TaxID=5077 RepID=A0A9W9TNS6_PENCI|nr:uncharacterized protein N7469_006107 [Penicillium citrinum]KAJ5231519.1 hypothetical protein N7469_006107 [Penicillium citrinum]
MEHSQLAAEAHVLIWRQVLQIVVNASNRPSTCPPGPGGGGCVNGICVACPAANPFCPTAGICDRRVEAKGPRFSAQPVQVVYQEDLNWDAV